MRKILAIHAVVIFMYGIGFIICGELFESLHIRITALEATIEKPELIHTCNLYDDKQRKLCGWIEVE